MHKYFAASPSKLLVVSLILVLLTFAIVLIYKKDKMSENAQVDTPTMNNQVDNSVQVNQTTTSKNKKQSNDTLKVEGLEPPTRVSPPVLKSLQ